TVAGRIDLDFDLCALRLAQRPGMLERCDGILVAEMHQHRAARLLRCVWRDLRAVVADRACNPVDMAGRTPGDRPAPAVTERCDLACALQPGLGCFEIGEGFLPGNFAAQI